MIALLTVIHVLVCFVLIGIVLLQPGKGADLAGAFGGQGSQTAFGPRGTANLLTKATAWAAVLFAITSVSLTVLIARRGNGHSVLHGLQSAPAHSVPAKHK
jgi:preprotein translocase subunit SecG